MSYTGEYKKLTYKAMAFMLVGLFMSVLPFLFIYQLIRPALTNETLTAEYVIWRVAAIAVCAILYSVLYIKGLAYSHESAFNTLKNIRISLQKKLEAQPLGAIQDKGVGAIKKLFIDDIESIELLLAHAIPEGVANIAVPVMVYTAMFIVDWKLALLSLCSLPLGLIAMGAMFKISMSKMEIYYSAARKMNNTIVEYINGMEVVKVFNKDGESYHRFESDIKSYRDFTIAWFKLCWPWMAVYGAVIPAVSMFTLPIGAYMVHMGYASLPDFALVLCMSFGIGAPLLRALNFAPTIPQLNYKISSLGQMLASPPLVQSDKPFSRKDHSVQFENVKFSYKDEEVIHGISLDVPEGSLTALVGESGSGKSTLAKLLVHYYDINGGSIKIGGQDIRDMSLEALNEQISYVAQEQFLFNTSLTENIRLGRLDATDEEVIAAASKAQCDEFFMRLENGINTMAGDGGKQLSGGERQRISLARAILKNAPIVVLDEATAFIDPENEEKMNAAIAEVIRGKTVVVIAHRLHSIVNADKICVLEAGNIIAEGTHSELLNSSPQYKKLWAAAEKSANWAINAEAGEVKI